MNTQNTCPSHFTPPCCPNPKCLFHNGSHKNWPYEKFGTFSRQQPPYTVQRFRCIACERTFSTQTFCTSYWLKRPDLLKKVFKHTVAGSANRQLARALGCAPATIENMIARLGRHCVLYHRQQMKKASPFVDIAVDGLVTFERSQYYPFEHLVAVDRTSSFFIHFTDAPLRRSGAMTEHQKKRRLELEQMHGRPDTKAVEKGMHELLEVALDRAVKAQVWSDKHRAYPRAIRRMKMIIDHQKIDSRIKRDRRSKLFEINALDMMLRHCMKNHTRETIAFSKRRQDSAYRLVILLVWKNYIKHRWEKKCRHTAGMLAGITDRVLTEEEVLQGRLFVHQIALPKRWAGYYWRRIVTVPQPVNRRHTLSYAC